MATTLEFEKFDRKLKKDEVKAVASFSGETTDGVSLKLVAKGEKKKVIEFLEKNVKGGLGTIISLDIDMVNAGDSAAKLQQ